MFLSSGGSVAFGNDVIFGSDLEADVISVIQTEMEVRVRKVLDSAEQQGGGLGDCTNIVSSHPSS